MSRFTRRQLLLITACFGLAAVSLDGVSQVAVPIWHMPGEGRGVPATDGVAVYFLTTRHEVTARQSETGKVLWTQRIGDHPEPTAGSAVVLAGGIVAAGDYDVFGLDRTNGRLRWHFVPAEGYGPGVYLGAAAGELLFAGSPAGRVYAIDASSGAERWSTLVAAGGKTTVFQPVTDGRVIVAAYTTFTTPHTGGVIALNASTGREQWRTAFPEAADGSGASGGPVLTENWVFATGGDGVIHALERATGALRWSFPGVREPSAMVSARDFRALARSGGLLAAGSLSGTVVVYDIDARRERWRRVPRPNASTGFTLASDEDCVYVPYVDGTLVVLNLPDGTERWRAGDWRTSFHWAPAISGRHVFVTSATGGFFAFAK